jgi:hypothetical protein
MESRKRIQLTLSNAKSDLITAILRGNRQPRFSIMEQIFFAVRQIRTVE